MLDPRGTYGSFGASMNNAMQAGLGTYFPLMQQARQSKKDKRQEEMQSLQIESMKRQAALRDQIMGQFQGGQPAAMGQPAQFGGVPQELLRAQVMGDAAGLPGYGDAAMEMWKRNNPTPPTGMRQGPSGWEYDPNYLSGQEQLRLAGASNITMGSPVLTTDEHGNTVMVQPANRPGVPPQRTPLPGLTPKGQLSEGQGVSALYYDRASEADRIMTDLEGKYGVTGLAAKQAAEGVWGVGGALGAAGNWMLSDEQQKVDQSQRDFVNAVLRKESGAVINPEEFDNAQKQYFPQPGDSQAVIQQKRKNRETAIHGLKRMAGPAARQKAGKPATSDGGAEITKTINGVKYIKRNGQWYQQ